VLDEGSVDPFQLKNTSSKKHDYNEVIESTTLVVMEDEGFFYLFFTSGRGKTTDLRLSFQVYNIRTHWATAALSGTNSAHAEDVQTPSVFSVFSGAPHSL